jgi:hypothetical protein
MKALLNKILEETTQHDFVPTALQRGNTSLQLQYNGNF